MRSPLTPNTKPSCESQSDGSSVGRRLRHAVVVVLSLISTLVPLSAGVAHAAPAVAQQKGSVPQLDRVAWTALMALEEISNGVRVDRPPVLSAKYVALRSQVAALVARRLSISVSGLSEAWARADTEHQIAVLAAVSQLGVPYRRFAMQPGVALDCSGLTTFAWGEAGFLIQRNSTQQMRSAEPRNILTAQAGDLVRYPGHIMMWLGSGLGVIHSPEPGRSVELKVLGSYSLRRSTFGDPSE
jgi:cell wall-associated NlpC family hydrolase